MNEVKTMNIENKNNILQMLFSLMEKNDIFGYEYKSDLDILISELAINESIWNEKMTPIFNINYEDAIKQIRKTNINQLNRENYSKITNIINKAEYEHSKLMGALGKLHAYKTINDKKIDINYFNMRAIAFHVYNTEKEKLCLRPILIINDLDNYQASNFVTLGKHSTMISNGKTTEVIRVNINAILKNYKYNKEECIYELLETIHHEISHSKIFNMITSYNVYSIDVMHAAMDRVINAAEKDSDLSGFSDYYLINYNDNKEERMARIYGYTKAIEEIKYYKKNINPDIISKKTLQLKKEEALLNIKNNNERKTNIDSFALANSLTDEYIQEIPIMIQIKPMLQHVYNINGKRKSIGILFDQRQEIIEQLNYTLNRVYHADIQIDKKISKFKEISDKIKEVKTFYDELIYLSFKKLSYEEFKVISYLHNEIDKCLDNINNDRQNRIDINDQALEKSIINFDEWLINYENTIKEYETIIDEQDKYDNYLKTYLTEKRYVKN